MPKFLVLHVSDVHFGCEDLLGDQGPITEGLVDAARRHVAQTRRRPDVCIFSGDLAHSGKAEQFVRGEAWLRELREATGTQAVFVVPGNHDTSRPRTSRNRAEAKKTRTLVHDLKQLPKVRERFHELLPMREFHAWHKAAKIRLGLVSDWESSRHACCAILGEADMKFAIVGLNSAGACFDDEDRGNLFVDMQSYSASLRRANPQKNLVIAVAHHPVSMSSPRTARWLAEWCDSDLKQRLMQVRGPHLYLHGHLHEARGYSINNSMGSGLFVGAAGAAYQGKKWPQKFAFLEVDTENQSVQPTVFSWLPASGEWHAVPAESQATATRLPRIHEAATAKTARVSAKAPAAPAISLDALDSASRKGAARWVPQHLVRQKEACRKLMHLFGALLDGQTIGASHTTYEQTIETLLSLAAPSRKCRLVGPPGSGKSEFLALAFWIVSTEPRYASRYRPIFVDLEYWEEDLSVAGPAALLSVVDHLGQQLRADAGPRTPVIFMRNADEQGWDEQSPMHRICEEIETRWGGTSLQIRYAQPERRLEAGPRRHLLLPLPAGGESAKLFVEGANGLLADPLDEEELSRNARDLETLCFAHRTTPNLFMARTLLESGRSLAKLSLARILSWQLNRCLDDMTPVQPLRRHARRQDRNTLCADLGKAAFNAYVINSSNEKPAEFKARQPRALRRLLSSSAMFDHWLVAQHVLARLGELGRLLEPANFDRERDGSAVRAICRELDCVYPTHITAFAKEMFQEHENDGPRSPAHAVLVIMSSKDLPVVNLLKATCCYFAGRTTSPAATPELVDLLKCSVEQSTHQLDEIRAVRRALGLLIDAGTVAAAEALLAHVQGLLSLRTVPATIENIDELLATAEREILLLQRSAYISLCYGTDTRQSEEYSEKYILGLLSDSERDDLNRGFHLEYYGDLLYRPDSPLLSSDRRLEPFPNTQACLVRSLSTRHGHVGGRAIQAVTLASFARHRHAEGKLDPTSRALIARCLADVGESIIKSDRIQQFIASVVAELAHDEHIVERYIDALYELKFQRRSGWQGVSHDESVAAHSYFVELLARLLVPTHGTTDLPDLERVVELVSFHDIGEAVVGDILHTQKTDKTRAEETTIVWRIAQSGALTGSDTFLQIADSFAEFERGERTPEAEIARDLDRLDLLIQLMRYRRENGTVGRYDEFRKHVAPSAFESGFVRGWAQRLLRYFDSASSQNGAPNGVTLWPTRINSVRIHRAQQEDKRSGVATSA